MGRSSWRAQSCRTCITRKVKCDKNKPECLQCKSSSRTCGGYNQMDGTILKKHSPTQPSQSSLAIFQSKRQLISRFLDDYLPPKTSVCTTYQSSILWVESFSDFLDSPSTIMETSLSALALMHMARSQKDDSFAEYSRYFYSRLVEQILGLRELKDPPDLVRAGMILALYETYSPILGQENAWPVHVKAACDFVNESHASCKNIFNANDLRRLYTMEFLRICSMDSIAAPSAPYLLAGSSNMFDQLLETSFQATISLYEYRVKTQAATLELTNAEHMLKATIDYETRLVTWYRQLQGQDDQPLFMVQSNPHRQQSTMVFPNESTIPLLLIYWLGMVAIYDSMIEALVALARQNTPENSDYFEQKLNEVETTFRLYIAHILHCQASVTSGNGLGTLIMVSATVSAAQKMSLRHEVRKTHHSSDKNLYKLQSVLCYTIG